MVPDRTAARTSFVTMDLTNIRRSFVLVHEKCSSNSVAVYPWALTERRDSYREYNSTINCSLTIG
jgi:hypothetical protein